MIILSCIFASFSRDVQWLKLITINNNNTTEFKLYVIQVQHFNEALLPMSMKGHDQLIW